VLQPELVLHLRRQVDVDEPLASDLDADEPAAARYVDQAGDLEPAQAELAGDLDLRPPVQVVPPRDQS
jgi:hypothetical protein